MFESLKLKLKTQSHKRKFFWQGIVKTIFLQIVFFGFFFALEKIMNIEPISIPENTVFLISGILLFLFFVTAFFSLKDLSPSFALKEKISKRGLYAFLRHPFYAGIIFFLNPAIALFFKSFGLFLACFVAFFIWEMQAKKEEKNLLEKNSKEYQTYQLKVPRMFFPKIFENAYSRKKAAFYVLALATSFLIVIVGFNLYLNITTRSFSFDESSSFEAVPVPTMEAPVVLPTPETPVIEEEIPIPVTETEITEETPPFNWQEASKNISFVFLGISLLGFLMLFYFSFLKKKEKLLKKKTVSLVLTMSVTFLLLGGALNFLSRTLFEEVIFPQTPIPIIQITPPIIEIPEPTTEELVREGILSMNQEGIYESLSGKVFVPKIGVEAPIVFVGDINWVNWNHKYGVVHYPETSFPGGGGAILLSGHSSPPPNVRGPYDYIFSKLNDLQANDEIIIHFKEQVFTYRIFRKEIMPPQDFRLREYHGKETVTLLSCWPVDTNARKIIIEGEKIN